MKTYPNPDDLHEAAKAVGDAKAAHKAAVEATQRANEARASADNADVKAEDLLAAVGIGGAGGNNVIPPTTNKAGRFQNWKKKGKAAWNRFSSIIIPLLLLLVFLVFFSALIYLQVSKADKSQVDAVEKTVSGAAVAAANANIKVDALTLKSSACGNPCEVVTTCKETKTEVKHAKCGEVKKAKKSGVAKSKKISQEKSKEIATPLAPATVVTSPQPATTIVVPAPCTTDCVPKEQVNVLREEKRVDGRCFAQTNFGYRFEVRANTSSGRLMVGLVDPSNDKLVPGTKASYVGNLQAAKNSEGFDCNGMLSQMYENWNEVRTTYELPSACKLVSK